MDLLSIERGSVVAPAGCGKTELIATALLRHARPLPILVLTHTHAGVAALRRRLERSGVSRRAYRLSTIDGWAMRLISTFPARSGHDPAIVEAARPDYPEARRAAAGLLAAGHVDDVIRASYDRLIVDEYQDCSCLQHATVAGIAALVPTAVLGDPMQAIFNFGKIDCMADWVGDVLATFPVAETLDTPWRWINAGAHDLGAWLLEVRGTLETGGRVDVRNGPNVTWVRLDGSGSDHPSQLRACLTKSPVAGGNVLIIGESTNPASQRAFASQTPGAVTVEAVDLQDLVMFSQRLDLSAPNALEVIVDFAESVMNNVGGKDFVRRVQVLRGGRARKEANGAESAAMAFEDDRCHSRVLALLSEINAQSGVRVYRPAVHRACMQALRQSTDADGFRAACVRMREEHRQLGRELPNRAVGSTLLLKGLEADVAVILSADKMDARHLYVAMTRGARKLVICSRAPTLGF
ncbi:MULTISPECIES: AAA family ATPase [Aureimonas]|uniref:DNA 3'-5' helicase II n=1 Tax=Aureimonas pseudogalii TaxID=1744844 RepID=A0A7W6MLE7_9HYPH|nr:MULTISPECIES: AAA family ATPase [Aureimonas]MBB3999703.1 DNA helicase-2/ATP-dependent DNA helicase PcrA [Aureimonas pseudogalii]